MSTEQDYQELYDAIQITDYRRGADLRRQIDKQMIQNVLVIWLDSNVNEKRTDYQNHVDNLHEAVNIVKVFGNYNDCENFLKVVADDKACMVISERLGQQIVPLLHDMPQINSIFILCENENNDEEWTKNWGKIKGVHSEIKSISAKLKKITQQGEQNSISMSILDDLSGTATVNGNRLDPHFMYTQIMKEIFLTITFENKDIDEFIQRCREIYADSKIQLKYVKELSEDYKKHSPIWWYTRESFLYSMLNGALRTMDVDVIIKFGFFIVDLDWEIRAEHSRQLGSHRINGIFTVYRGQGMYIKEFEKMIGNEGGLLSFNNFLSTSEYHDHCLMIADSNALDCNLYGVLFVIKIDSTRPSAPFAYVADKGYFGDQEKELLFSTHAVFRIGKNSRINDNPRLVQVELTLTSDNDNDLLQLVEYVRQETIPGDPGWYRLGQVLRKMGEPIKAEQIYERLLEETTNERNKALIYHQLGLMKFDQEKYAEARAFYEKSIEIEKKQINLRYNNLSMSYNNMGSVYLVIGDYSQAIFFYKEVLAVQEQSLSPTQSHLALSYIGIGTAHHKMNDYKKGLESYEKALQIQEVVLPPTHPHLATLYNNMGVIYDNMSKNQRALEFHEKALTIQEQSLPSTHPDLAASYGNIGSIYQSQEKYEQAFSYYEKALAIEERLPGHPRLGLASSYNNLGQLYDTMDQYDKALEFQNKALAIRAELLPPNHPDLGSSYNSIGILYKKKEEYPKALSFYEKAMDIQKKSLPSTLYAMASTFNNIGNVHRYMGNYSKAFAFYEKMMVIQQQSFFPDDHDLARVYSNMARTHTSRHKYWKADLYWQDVVNIAQRSLRPEHSHQQQWRFDYWLIRTQL